MSTTRTNDKALTKRQQAIVKRRQWSTDITKQFENCKYANRTEWIYFMHDYEDGCERVECKVGRTSLRAALVCRSAQGCTYKNKYSFLDGTVRKRYAPISDDELKLLEADIQARIDSEGGFVIKNNKKQKKFEEKKQALDYFVNPPHGEFRVRYLASSRFGDKEYAKYPIIHGWYAFPYEVVNGVLHDQGYWEDKVNEVLKSFRLKHRILEVPRRYFDEDGTSHRFMSKVQNVGDNAENALFTVEHFNQYRDLYTKTCRELGGIFVPFTHDFFPRHQINDDLRNNEFLDSELCTEQTKCFWEAIKKQIERDDRQHTIDAVTEEINTLYPHEPQWLKEVFITDKLVKLGIYHRITIPLDEIEFLSPDDSETSSVDTNSETDEELDSDSDLDV